MEENNEVMESPSRGRRKKVRLAPRRAADLLEAIANDTGHKSATLVGSVRPARPQLNAMEEHPREKMSEEEYQEAVSERGV